MYITTGVNDTVIALDARTGTAKWKFQPKLGFTTFCCGSNNRVSWWTMEGIRGHARRIAEYGIRVSVTAYSQADGKQVWRWWATNPGQGVLREP